MAEVKYDYGSNAYSMGIKKWPEIVNESKQVIKDTEPYTLKTIQSRSVTLNDRLFIMHNLSCQKDSSQSEQSIKTPVKVMDFTSQKLNSIEYLNKDSEGTTSGESKDKKSTILP